MTDEIKLTDEEKAKFRQLMNHYQGSGGPILAIYLADLYDQNSYDCDDEGSSVSKVIKSHVDWSIGQTHRKKIDRTVEAMAVKLVNGAKYIRIQGSRIAGRTHRITGSLL